MKLLLVEDDHLLASRLALRLEREHWQVTVAHEGRDALHRFRSGSFDLVAIDWGLPPPGPSGIELCAELRALSPDVGLVFVTGKVEIGDRLLAFKAGADDYIVKPFNAEELVARMTAVTRRTAVPGTMAHADIADDARGTFDDNRLLVHGSVVVDMETLRVTVDRQEIDLSLRQLLILIYLIRNRGRLVPESELRERVLRTATVVQTSTMRNHIHQLRDRLGSAKSLIRSVHGMGYGIGVAASPKATVTEMKEPLAHHP